MTAGSVTGTGESVMRPTGTSMQGAGAADDLLPLAVERASVTRAGK